MRFSAGACIFLLIASPAFAQSTPQNLDFESGAIGQPPTGWTVKKYPENLAVSAKIDDSNPQSGRASGTLTISEKTDGEAALSQDIDATPYRGKFVVLRAAARVQNGAHAMLRIRAIGANGEFYPGSTPKVDESGGWKFYHATASVPLDAAKVSVALIQGGAGNSSIDSVSLQTVDASQLGYEPPHPLSARGLINLHAFARLFGYVRFFHPSDEGAKAHWQDIAIAGVQRAENARDATALVAALRAVFIPVAPTLRIYLTGGPVPTASAALSDPPSGATIVGWEHHGVHGDGDDDARRNGFYTSKRVAMTTPLPDHPFAADLGGGVSVLMPTTLYRDSSGTLPHTNGTAMRPDKPELFEASGKDRATRLADVVLSWTVFQNFDPNFVDLPVDMPATLDAALQSAATDHNEFDFQRTLQKEVAALRDGHGNTYLLSQTTMVLPVYWEWIENHIVVMPGNDTPVLKGGDVITKIGGRPVDALIVENMPLISSSTPWGAMGKLLWLLRLRTSSAPVHIEALRGNEKIVADLVPLTGASYHYPLDDVTELKPGIWYVDLRQLSKADLDANTTALSKAKAVIFDMRGYPSHESNYAMYHLSDAPIHTVHFDVPVTTLPDRIGVRFQDLGFDLPPVKPRFRGRFFFLTNATAQSQAEMFMSYVEDNHLGTIIGSTTAGIDGEENFIHLPGGYEISWTGMRVLKYDGSRFQGVGVSPNIPVSPTIAGIRAGRDEVLDKAIEIATSGTPAK
ncbi:MAG TPA: S41 family peptidase [Rhizomicrobium sp.]